MLDVSPLYKAAFCPEIHSFSPDSKSVQSFVPHYHQFGCSQLPCCQVPSNLFLFTWILLPNPTFVQPSHHLHPSFVFILIILSVFLLGFFITISQEKGQRGSTCQVLFILQFPIPAFWGGKSSGLILAVTRASFSPRGWRVARECPLSRLVLADAGFFCCSWSCPQLCQNLGGKRANRGRSRNHLGDNQAQQMPSQ